MRHQGDAQKHGVKSNAPLTKMDGHSYARTGVEAREYATQHVDEVWTTCG
jgi:hypothetical protein